MDTEDTPPGPTGSSAEPERLLGEIRRLAAELADERRHAAEVERRYRGLVDRLDAIFWEADAETFEFTYVSPRAEPLTGYPMERWLHEPGFWVKILHPDDRDWVVDCCARATAAGRDNDFEYRALTADGRVMWMRDMVYVERDETGRPRLLRGVMLDITAQKRVEEALRESGAAKDQFLAMLAHELRNPLGALSNALQVLRSARPEEPVWRRALDVAERQVNHQARLVTDLLDVSRLMHDRIETHRRRLDLAALVREAAEDCRSLVKDAGLALALELPPGPVWVEGDPTQLAQVLTNLLNNAAKFTEHGGRITLSLAPDAGPGRVAVRVTDTGIGISPEMLPHVWEVFSQADRSLDRSRGGLGLGLALVKGLVELHGGEVRAESPGLGCGSTFTALLPLAEAPGDEADTQPGLRILLVEDNRDAAETLRDLLELSGHRVELAFSGPAALEVAPRFQPEVVLCDIGLPGMDGYAVARQLRSDGATALAPGARLVALTGYGREEDRRCASEAGFDLHLVKPVKPGELQRLLETWAAERLPTRREGGRKR